MAKTSALSNFRKLNPAEPVLSLNQVSLLNVLRFLFALNLLVPVLFCFLQPGLVAESDTLDYRWPIIQWVFRHFQYPNFPWTYVDDAPAVGDFLMGVLAWIGPRSMRWTGVVGYFSFAYATLLISKRVLNKTWAYLTTIIVISSSLITKQDNLLMIDLLASSFFLWAVFYFLKFLDGTKSALAWCGLFCGLSIATRLTQIPPVCVLGIFVLFAVGRKREWGWFSLFCALSLALPFPWFLRNILINGNPLYPVLVSVFGGKDLDLQRAQEINALISGGYGFGTSLLEFLRLPFRLAFFPAAFDYSAGPWFLSFIPWIAMNGRKKKFFLNKENFIFTACFLLTLVWFLSSQQTRFWLHVLPFVVLSGLLGMRAWFLEDTKGHSKFFYSLFFILFLSLSFLGTARHFLKHKEELRDGASFVFHEDVVRWVNNRTPVNAKVLLFERTGNLAFIHRDFVFLYPHPYATRYLDHRLSSSVKDYIAALKVEGIGYIYVEDLNVLLPSLRASLRLMYQGKSGGFVYALQ